MGDVVDMGPVPVPWWRLLLIGAVGVALYFAVRALATSPQTHPLLLVPAALLGGVAGLLAGRWEVHVLVSPPRRGRGSRRLGRRRHAVPMSAARSYVVGLAGAGLVLANALPIAAMEWVMLGMVALMAGGAGHACVLGRHYERNQADHSG